MSAGQVPRTADLVSSDIVAAACTAPVSPAFFNLDDFTVVELSLFAKAFNIQAPVGLRKAELKRCIEEKLTETHMMQSSQQQPGNSQVQQQPGTPTVRPKESGNLAPKFTNSPSPKGGATVGTVPYPSASSDRVGVGVASPARGLNEFELSVISGEGPAARGIESLIRLRQIEHDTKVSEVEALKLRIRAAELEMQYPVHSPRPGTLQSAGAGIGTRTTIPGTATTSPGSATATPSAAATAPVTTSFDVSKHIPLVPQFKEAEVDSYFDAFERIASTINWPRNMWSLLLQCKLVGKARDVCAALPIDQSLDYDVVKQTIQRAYALVPEAYRQRFRSSVKTADQTYVEFAREKSVLFDKWCTATNALNAHQIRELILLEEFKSCLDERIVVYLNEQKVDCLSKAAVCADEFVLTHRSVFSSPSARRDPTAGGLGKNSKSKSPPKPGAGSSESRACFYCHTAGHVISVCPVLQRKDNQNPKSPKSKPVGFIQSVSPSFSPVTTEAVSRETVENFGPFLLDGFVSLSGQDNDQVPITILRDTGASQSLILRDVLPFSEKSFLGADCLVLGVEMNSLRAPLHSVFLRSPLVSGCVQVGIRESLPVGGVSLILGNDLAGGKVFPTPEIVDNPVVDFDQSVSSGSAVTFPACAVTRAQARRGRDEMTLNDTFMCSDQPVIPPAVKPSQKDAGFLPIKTDFVFDVKKEAFVSAQQNDPTLTVCWGAARAQDALGVYSVVDGILMRTWFPPNIGNLGWNCVQQVVIPQPFRSQVLSLAHDNLAGHLGIRKMYLRILRYFYWPGLKSDVAKFCRSCHVCQIMGKPNQIIPPAPLVPIPVVGEPFHHISLPLPSSSLQAKFSGPYVIEKKLSETDYVVSTPDRRKKTRVCHVNMIKPYVTRSDRDAPVASPVPVASCVNVMPSLYSPEKDGLQSKGSGGSTLQNSEFLKNLCYHLQHLDPVARGDVANLITTFPTLFSDTPTQTTVLSHDVDVGDNAPIKQHAYRVNPTKRALFKKEVDYLLDNGLAVPSCSSWSSPCILVPKACGGQRFCTDYRKVNSVTKSDSFPLPLVEDLVDRVGAAKFVTKLDLLKGYWQVPLTARASDISAFVTPDGLYQYTVMPFGLRNAPATFQRLMRRVLGGVPNVEIYLDDCVLYSDSWSSHMHTLEMVFSRLAAANLTLNLSKCAFAQATVTYLGREVGQGKVRALDSKVRAIIDYPVPSSRRSLRRFLGMSGYYRAFCKNFADVVAPLTSLTSLKKPYVWSPACQHAFESCKALLCSTPVLAAPDFQRPFKLDVDASGCGAGAVLLQEDDSGTDHPICYFSKKFNSAQSNYSTIEQETLSLLLALQFFEVYVGSSPLPVKIYTDHNPLVFLKQMRNSNQRLMRWSLLVQDFNLDICHKKGADNVLADALSRVYSPD